MVALDTIKVHGIIVHKSTPIPQNMLKSEFKAYDISIYFIQRQSIKLSFYKL